MSNKTLIKCSVSFLGVKEYAGTYFPYSVDLLSSILAENMYDSVSKIEYNDSTKEQTILHTYTLDSKVVDIIIDKIKIKLRCKDIKPSHISNITIFDAIRVANHMSQLENMVNMKLIFLSENGDYFRDVSEKEICEFYLSKNSEWEKTYLFEAYWNKIVSKMNTLEDFISFARRSYLKEFSK